VPASTSAVSSSIGNKPYRRSPYPLHPLQLFLLGGATCFLVSGFLSDWAYFSTHEIQWKNFASWLIMGGLVFGGIAFMWALIDVIGADQGRNRRLIYVLLLLAAWILGFIDDLIHAKDAWASMPAALMASAIMALLAIAATWLGLSICARGR
jgi:uncharacterized membrane protein